jgi:hypothetical protein
MTMTSHTSATKLATYERIHSPPEVAGRFSQGALVLGAAGARHRRGACGFERSETQTVTANS